jgi:glutamyl-tRNA synthetase
MTNARDMVRTRFAPSPSGHLHVGGARTALFCWAYARKRGGRFMLRIEDTDQKRSSDAASIGFLKDLKWLGIDWDEGPEFEGCGGGAHGPYFQSQRLDIYTRCIDRLIASGRAYRAFETPEELEAARARAKAEGRAYRYDRAALRLDAATIERFVSEQRPHVVRFRIPDDVERTTFHDQVRGENTVERTELDDFVIRKADGFPMYNFAVVVDDEMMGVTHVIRAQEHLSNTIRHVLLQEALGFRRPVYAHLSVITNPDGSKMSKRDKDKALRAAVKARGLGAPPRGEGGAMTVDAQIWAWWLSDKDHQLDLDAAERLAAVLQVQLPEINVDDFRRAGYLPEVMVNYLSLLGWSPGDQIEKFDAAFLIERFDLDRVIKSPAKFDRAKLLAFNNDAIAAMPPEEFHQRFRRHCEVFHPEFTRKLTPDQFRALAIANQPRCKTLEDAARTSRFFILPDETIMYEDSKPVREAMLKGQPGGYDHLEAMLPVLETLSPWNEAALEAAIKTYAESAGGGNLGRVAQPLRIAVSGGVVSPAIYVTLAILGRETVLNRIRRCLSMRPCSAAS